MIAVDVPALPEVVVAPDVPDIADVAVAVDPDVPGPEDVPIPDVLSEDVPEPPAKTYAYDLDGDGTADTDLSVAACDAGTCLVVDSTVTAVTSVPLSPLANGCSGNVVGTHLRVIGDHLGGPLHEVSAVYCPAGPPALAVVDVEAAAVVANAVAPAGIAHAWVDHPSGPDGLLYPFLAPSYGDGGGPAPTWGTVCVFKPGTSSSCGAGFGAAAGTPSPTAFREVGGVLQDLDGDGFEDITLIFHTLVHTVSTASLAVLNTLQFDVAAVAEPASPKWFHSGRNYGSHAAHKGADGVLRQAIVAGAPVGTFTDYNCNVSRFVAVLASQPGAPATRTLAWSNYFGFASTIFSAYGAQWAGNPAAVVARPADVMDGCIHRFSDSRSVMDGQEVLVFNYFAQTAPVDLCLSKQYQLYVEPTWTDEKADAWYGCFASNVGAMGLWGMQVLRESDGLPLTGSQQTYVWGRTSTALPSGEAVYLVEYVLGDGRWDLADRELTPIRVQALVEGLWTERGVFPVAGRPKIRTVVPTGAVGLGSYSFIAELSEQDLDGDGVLEIELDDGAWVGWDAATQAFVIKQ